MKRQVIEAPKAEFHTEAERILKLLNDDQAFILTNPKLPHAGVFKNFQQGQKLDPLATTSRENVQQMYVRDWLTLSQHGEVMRYDISDRGIAVLPNFDQLKTDQATPVFLEDIRPKKTAAAEKPIRILARKSDKNGKRYISARLVAAAEHLREDFEVSGLDRRVTQNWDEVIKKHSQNFAEKNTLSGGALAKARWAAAMDELGAGLSDIVYLVCCLEEGLESAEKLLGWSARSGKIVLRIALIRLADFYEIPKFKGE